MSKLLLLIWLCLLLACKAERTDLVASDVENSSDDETDLKSDSEDVPVSNERFRPTDQWQTIKPGQSIPSGLHVRMNLQTGHKEAKFLESSKTKPSPVHPGIPLNDYSKQSRKYSPQKLKEALKAIKADDVVSMTEEEAGQTQAKFRSIDQLKKDLETLHLNVKTESEIVSDILKTYRKTQEADKIVALQDLEFIVHKYDTAQDFVKMGGLDVILPDLNSTSGKVRSWVAFTLGSAMQGNPQVQVASLERNSLNHLLRMVTMDPEFTVRLRALYALSCLVRQFPFAQKRLVENGGVTTLADILKEQTNPEMHKLQLKVVTLVQDLLTEQEIAKQLMKENEIENVQYDNYNLAEALVSNGVCELVPKLLPVPDIDTQEKVIGAMNTMVPHCKTPFKKNLAELRELAQGWRIKAAKEESADDDRYYVTLHHSVNELIKTLEKRTKDEL